MSIMGPYVHSIDPIIGSLFGVLVGGRLVEVVFYEWPFYRDHLHLIPAMWLGGVATHGLLAGGIVGVWLFCRVRGKSFLRVTDALIILSWRRGRGLRKAEAARVPTIREGLEPAGVGWRHMLFVVLLLFALVIPSDWTQDVPARYGRRHPGLRLATRPYVEIARYARRTLVGSEM